MKLHQAAEQFMTEYFSGRRRVKKTQAAYLADLEQFCEFAGNRSLLAAVTQSLVTKWFDALRAKSYSPATLRRKTAVLRVFCSFWARTGQLSESPFWRMRLDVGAVDQTPATLSGSEVRALLVAAQRERDADEQRLAQASRVHRTVPERLRFRAYRAQRNLTIVALLQTTGIRVGEASALDIADFSPKGLFMVKGVEEGKSRRAYVLDQTSLGVIRDYLAARRNVKAQEPAFFINASGSRLSTQGITNVLRKLCAQAGVRRVTAGMFRNTFESTLLQKRVDLRVILKALGKSSIPACRSARPLTNDHIVGELRKVLPSLRLD